MPQSVLPYLMRVICLLLVILTGATTVAYAEQGGSHGSHCSVAVQDELSAQHEHDPATDSAHTESEAESCAQHSCVTAEGTIKLLSLSQNLLAGNSVPHDDLLRASIDAGSLHRPPIA